jgi:hypothetical protein
MTKYIAPVILITLAAVLLPGAIGAILYNNVHMHFKFDGWSLLPVFACGFCLLAGIVALAGAVLRYWDSRFSVYSSSDP